MSNIKVTLADLTKINKSVYLVESVTTKTGEKVFLICRDNRKFVRKDFGWKIFVGADHEDAETHEPLTLPHDRREKCMDAVTSRIRKGEFLVGGESKFSGSNRHIQPIQFDEEIRAPSPAGDGEVNISAGDDFLAALHREAAASHRARAQA